MMRTRIAAATSALLLALTLAAPTATATATAEQGQEVQANEPTKKLFMTLSGWSNTNVQVAEGRAGAGSRFSVRPGGGSPVKVESIWYPAGYVMHVNGLPVPDSGRWYDFKWYQTRASVLMLKPIR